MIIIYGWWQWWCGAEARADGHIGMSLPLADALYHQISSTLLDLRQNAFCLISIYSIIFSIDSFLLPFYRMECMLAGLQRNVARIMEHYSWLSCISVMKRGYIFSDIRRRAHLCFWWTAEYWIHWMVLGSRVARILVIRYWWINIVKQFNRQYDAMCVIELVHAWLFSEYGCFWPTKMFMLT